MVPGVVRMQVETFRVAVAQSSLGGVSETGEVACGVHVAGGRVPEGFRRAHETAGGPAMVPEKVGQPDHPRACTHGGGAGNIQQGWGDISDLGPGVRQGLGEPAIGIGAGALVAIKVARSRSGQQGERDGAGEAQAVGIHGCADDGLAVGSIRAGGVFVTVDQVWPCGKDLGDVRGTGLFSNGQRRIGAGLSPHHSQVAVTEGGWYIDAVRAGQQRTGAGMGVRHAASGRAGKVAVILGP